MARYDAPDSEQSVGWTHPQRVRLVAEGDTMPLAAGHVLGPIDVEYECYGEPNAAGDNVILITHALSGDAHVAGWDAAWQADGRPWRERKPGWWDAMVGPGKAIDTTRWCVLCSNVLGSCYGTTGPASIDPATGKAYGMRFPVVTVEDWVALQARLLDHLGIERLHAVVGGSLGGQQAIEWTLAYPERVGRALVLAAGPRLSAQGLAFNAVGRHAIMSDPRWQDGDYDPAEPPADGLAAARMLAHITYLSEEGMHEKFGRRLQDKQKPEFGFGVEFQVESYLAYQGRSFTQRFDANAYLYITRAMDYYDVAERWGGGDLIEAARGIQAEVMVTSFSTDWLYTPDDSRRFANALTQAGRPVTYVDMPSAYGHDAFLVEIERLGPLLRNFLHRGHGG